MTIADTEGIVLDDLDSVRREALKGARDIMAADIRDGRLSLRECIVVTDEEGAEVHRLCFADAVSIEVEMS